jgi:hypothetical protein
VTFQGYATDPEGDNVGFVVNYRRVADARGNAVSENWYNFGQNVYGGPDGVTSTPLYNSATLPTSVNVNGWRPDVSTGTWGNSGTAYNYPNVALPAGRYEWRMRALDDLWSYSGWDGSQYFTVSPPACSVSSFSGSPLVGQAPLYVNFTGATADAQSTSLVYGDGQSSTFLAGHTYDDAGSYTASYSCTGFAGNVNTRTVSITVTPPPPELSCDISPSNGLAPLVVKVQAVSAHISNLGNFSYRMGDGSADFTGKPGKFYYTYSAGGSYNIMIGHPEYQAYYGTAWLPCSPATAVVANPQDKNGNEVSP